MLILASKSKRRQAILSSCGIKYKIIVTNVREHLNQHMDIPYLVTLNAKTKAEHAARLCNKNDIVLGVDTLVSINNKTIGKPKDKKHALFMLKKLSGNTLKVYTGLYLLNKNTGKGYTAHDETFLRVRKIEKPDIPKFFKLLSPYDRAGGFSIEGVGSILFDNLKGSYFNVLGLPMGALADLFKKANLNILDFINLSSLRGSPTCPERSRGKG
ncbi:MAG: septum formation protein Maf [Candidatus Omnitrophica bacterium]|nr:septum formation protein Maf [Candidatus Omnitrophota bacterium]